MRPRGFAVGYALVAALVAGVVLGAVGAVGEKTLDLIFLAWVGWMIFRVTERRLGGTGAAITAMLVIGSLVGLQRAEPTIRYMPFLAIIPANLALAVLFARGLLPRRRPVLLTLVEIMGLAPVTDPSFRRFIAGQCALWSLMTLATALTALAALLHEPSRPDLAFVLKLLIAAQIVWFAISHRYAGLRYGRPERWWMTVRAMTRPEVWSKLRTE